MGKHASQKEPGGSTGEAGTAVQALEPIPDPFLEDDLRQFQLALDELKATEGAEHRRAAERLCELSRDILLRVQPAEEYPVREREAIVALFRKAADGICVPKDDRQVTEYRDHIRDRARDL